MDTLNRLSKGPEASTAMKELTQKPVVRMAETRVDIGLRTERKTAIEAGLVQCGGNIARTGCEYCMNGNGPFPHCVTLPGYLNGACANCHYYSTGSRCSFRLASHDARQKSRPGSPPQASSRKRKRPMVKSPVALETRLINTVAVLQAQTSKVRAASFSTKTSKAPEGKGPVNGPAKKVHARHEMLMAASTAAKNASVFANETAKALKNAAKTQQSFAISCSHLAELLADEAKFDTNENRDEFSSSSGGSETGDHPD